MPGAVRDAILRGSINPIRTIDYPLDFESMKKLQMQEAE
jgi:hypothetical protein